MQLVAQDAETHELEEVLRQDAGLAYQLLRLVNSPAIGVRREVTSFSQALLMLGRQQLKRWLNLLLFAAREDDPRSAMLMAHVVLR
ncbi:HDOD domain-containing protein, partial [Arthrospira platensis SPKY1]|nr:HDOD domain-containing protein [Arthrospira platensis SPKY1]